jgi:membrane protein implicated in regulation of membrane protease activity
MLCHLPLLFPLAGLLLFAFLPLPVALAVYLPLAGLSTFAGLKVIEAMRQRASTGAEGMRGAEGVVVTARGRQGVARVRGELWNVASPESLVPGARVTIEELRGLTALVRPLSR